METKVIDTGFENKQKQFPKSKEYHKKQVEKRSVGQNSSEIILFLVDDDLMFLRALEHSIISQLPHLKIKTFHTGEEALAQINLNPAIVILDYYLDSKIPNALDGLDVLKKIKKSHPKIKVIMLSAQDSLDIAINCVDNRAFDYVSKNASAFVRINNIISNIIEDIELDKKGFKFYQVAIILVFLLLLISILFKL